MSKTSSDENDKKSKVVEDKENNVKDMKQVNKNKENEELENNKENEKLENKKEKDAKPNVNKKKSETSKEKENNSKERLVSNNRILEISKEAKDNLNLQKKNNKEEKALLKEENIDSEKLEKIKDEIKKSKKESKEKIKNSNLRKSLIRNCLIAIIITIYFLFIDLGINSISITVYTLDLKTFSIFIAIIAIVIFEKAYKKDENYLAIHGIEMCLVGIETLLLLQLYSAGNEYFNYVLLGITLGMIAYYLLKCLALFIRYKVKGK